MSPRIDLTEVSKAYPIQGFSDPGLTLARLFSSGPVRQSGSQHWKTAVDKVSLSIGTGERLGIVGRNGAGKSTLLSMLAGVTAPSSGTITVEGHVTSILTLGVGLREDLSGRENIYIDGEVQGRSRSQVDHVIDDIMAFADLGEFIDYPVRTYSTGMKARLAFAMTFHIEPEILVIDEALAVGDAVFSIKATQKIRELCSKGKIVIIVSHSMDSVIDICTRCLWMEDGRMVMDGAPRDVTRAYIESIRQKDEAEMLARFRSMRGARVLRPGCEVKAIELRQGGDEPRSILKAGEDTAITLSLQALDFKDQPDVRLLITRLDGLVVTENYLSREGGGLATSMSGVCMLTLDMRPLVLSPGVYRILVELLDGIQTVAERSVIMEVIAEKVPSGGRPALIYPCSISAQAVAR